VKTYDPAEQQRLTTWENVSHVLLSGPFALGVGWLYMRMAF
jgi:hypothetical protein